MIKSLGEKILELENVVKHFGGLTAVDGVSFRLENDEILGLIGPNGAGKTTLFNVIMGVNNCDEGRILFQEEDITNLKPHKVVNKGIARIRQIGIPFDQANVLENINLSSLPNSFLVRGGGVSEEETKKILSLVGLEEYKNHLPENLPHVARRKLELARALATKPKLLLIDEAFVGCNLEEIEELSNMIMDIHERGIPIIFVDHNMKGLLPLVNRVVVLHYGELIAEGEPERIVEDEEVRKAYLGSEEGEDV